ncbi:MAG: non-ribosomal peptide synthetase, partial [Tumebacillaceae bacterium]
GLIGFFVNTLVLRANLADAPTFAELLQQVRQVTLDAFAHQEVPFEKLVEELQPERSQSHTPLFQVMFVLQNAPQSTLELPGLTMSLLDVEHGTSKYDLLLSMHETVAGLAGSLEYSTDLFEKETISRLLTHLELLLEQVVEHPNRAITDLQFLSQAEMDQLQQWSRTETAERPAVCVHQLFEAQVALTPDQVALVFEEERMTYAELNSQANRLARYLQDLGVGQDVPVGLCVERSFDLVVGVLGILKAGGAYVSLDPAYPQERLAVIREEAGMSVVVTQDALRHLFDSEVQAIALDADGERIEQFAADNLTVDVTNDHLAYLLFTSGSTGRPKGVAMGHRPLVNLIAWQLEQFQTAKQARTMQFASLNFDVSFQEIFSTLCAGGTLCIPREEIRKDGERLLDFLARHQVERVFLPYIVLQHLSEVATKRADGALAIREIITAGEQLQMTPPIVQWVERLPGCVVHNQYGPTESHVATAQTLTGSPHTWPLLPSIGRPIANTEVCVLDTQMKRVPVGVPGELYIGGVSLARGYWQRPDLTKERFVPHPFRTGAEERLYKTGDLVRYLADGSLDYLGRIDGQVKVRGFRIELGEIEAVLAQHPDVTECVAVVREDVPGDKRLVAYVVADSSEQDMSIYRRWLQSRLPDYMLPSAFVKLEALPVTPNGKVDRRELPAPAATNVRRDEGPRTPEEAQVARIWSEVLRVDAIGREDNFFEIGGHSLLAAQVMTRISQTFGCDTPLRLLFEHSTLAELTEQVQRLKLGQEHEQATHLRPIPLEARGVLSFSQERALAVYHSSADKASRNMPCVLRMQGNLHVEALGRAIHEIIRRNEILRTAYVEQDGQTVQVVRPYPYQPMAVVDLSELSPQQQ